MKVGQDGLRDVLGQRFQQRKVFVGENIVDAVDDQRIIERVMDVVGLACAASGQGDFQVELDGLRHDALPRVYAD